MSFFCETATARAQVIYRKLAFRDEFNKVADTPVDASKWTTEIGDGWGGHPDTTTVFPGEMLVDYVRVYRR